MNGIKYACANLRTSATYLALINVEIIKNKQIYFAVLNDKLTSYSVKILNVLVVIRVVSRGGKFAENHAVYVFLSRFGKTCYYLHFSHC